MVRGMRGVGGVCEMCICYARGGVGGEGDEWMRELSWYFTNHVAAGGVLDVCPCFVLWWCMWGVDRGLGPMYRGVAWCYVYVGCEPGLYV